MDHVHDLISLAHILEDNICFTVRHSLDPSSFLDQQSIHYHMYSRLSQFYRQPEILPHRYRSASKSLTSQLLYPEKVPNQHLTPQNFFSPLVDDLDVDMTTMDIDNQDSSKIPDTNDVLSQNINSTTWNDPKLFFPVCKTEKKSLRNQGMRI